METPLETQVNSTGQWKNITLNNDYQNQESYEKLQTVFTIAACVIILATIFGNILVVLAVCVEKKLRKVGNYYLVSLAMSDMFVGVLVTPLALLYHSNQSWLYGKHLCEFWTSMDVICCTASIVNLGVISIDRYFAITVPMKYAAKRTPIRATFIITCTWLYSVAIALPPVLGLRNKIPAAAGICEISQNKWYAMYATFGAFYLPMVLMMVSYARVFKATLKRKKNWISIPAIVEKTGDDGRLHRVSVDTAVWLNATDSVKKYYMDKVRQSYTEKQTCSNDPNLLGPPINPHIGYRLMKSGDSATSSSMESLDPACDTPSTTSRSVSPLFLPSPQSSECKLEQQKVIRPRRLPLQVSTSTSVGNSSADMPLETITPSMWRETHLVPNHSSPRSGNTASLLIRPPNGTSYESSISENQSNDYSKCNEIHSTRQHPRKKIPRKRPLVHRISLSQEKRLAKTLGIIIGCFIICWLPFFLVALIRPWCATCRIPPLLLKTVTWLGYFNSALNPIIYTFFNQDFRRAFQRILSCHCLKCKKQEKLLKKRK